ncbi:MAG: TetR/AcrR family transcriptional regulator [Candidatus Thorarchaeota archaeon]
MTLDKGRNPKTKKLRAIKKERTRQTIHTEAEKLFSEKPFNEVILEDIADAAVVSRTTLYNYFKNKDAIFFGIGIEHFEELINLYGMNYSDKLSGIDQVLQFCKIGFTFGRDNPLTQDIIREFYRRIQYSNISLEDWSAKYRKFIAKHRVGTEQHEELLEEYDEPYLFEFYFMLERHNHLWINAIKKGKSDGTIKTDLNEKQIVEFLYMILMGIEAEMNLRESTLNRIGLNDSTIEEHIMNLITSFLGKK